MLSDRITKLKKGKDLGPKLTGLVLVILFFTFQLAGWFHPHAHGLTKDLSYLFDLQNFYGTTFCEHTNDHEHYETTDDSQSCQEECLTCLNILQLFNSNVPEKNFNFFIPDREQIIFKAKFILQVDNNNSSCRSPPTKSVRNA